MPRAARDDAPADPNKLIRSKAGTYRTADDRFEVRQAALGWFLIDSSATDELGQELTRGPYPTLKAIGDQLPAARRTTIKPLSRPRASTKAAAQRSAKRAKPPPLPKTWLDRLPAAEASAARRVIQAMALEGIEDADTVVQAARKADDAGVARRVLEHRVERLLDDLPAAERPSAQKLLGRVLELVTVKGTAVFDPLPGWALVEVPAGDDPPARRIVAKLSRRS